MKTKRVFIASGGSGGHLIPSQMLAQELKSEYGCEIHFCGKGLQRFFSLKDYSTLEIRSAPFFHKNPLKTLKGSAILLWGFFQSFRHIRKHRPDIVVGFGSYHAFPVLLAAYVLKKPIVLFEPNCVLGRVNRFFANKCAKIAIQFPTQKPWENTSFVPHLPWSKISGNKSLQHGLDPKVFTFLVFGGSQGAKFINEFFLKAVSDIQELQPKFQVIHLTGSSEMTQEAQKQYAALNIACYVRDFEPQMDALYEIADFAICRSGANTMGELIRSEVPALFIPYPFAADQHQKKNAEFLSNRVRGAILCEQKNLTLELFLLILKEGIEENRFAMLQKNLQQYKAQESLKTKQKLSEMIYTL